MSKASRARRAEMRALERRDAEDAPLGTITLRTMQQHRADDWANVLTALGTSKDKRLQTSVVAARRFSRAELTEAYRGNDVVGTLIDLPADEMTREWIDFCADDDPENEANAAVLDFLDGADEGPEEEQGLQCREAFHASIKWSRLYGGAAIVMGVNDGQSPDKPVNYDNIQSVDYLNVFDRYSIRPFAYYNNPFGKKHGKPAMYELTSTFTGSVGARNLIHESRVVPFHGVELSAEDMARHDGWGDSILARVWEVVRDYASVWMGFSYLVSDAAHTTIKMEGIRAALSKPDGKRYVQARMEAIELARSIARAVILDSGEEFKREVVNLSGVPDAMQKFVERLAQAARMPIELLMGQPPGGLNGNGETGKQYWYSQIGGMQERELRRPLKKILRVVLAAKNGPTKGKVPEKWAVEFRPLEQPTDEQRAEVLSKIAQAGAALVTADIVDPEELANSFFGSGKLSLDIKLDKAIRAQMTAKLEQGREPGPSPEELAAAAKAKATGGKDKPGAKPV